MLLGLPEPTGETGPLQPLLCVARNLIARGTPTPPPAALAGALGPLPHDAPELPRYVDTAREPQWDGVIKGADSGCNPALDLWRSLCAALPPDLAHLRALIRPEAPLGAILADAGLDHEATGQTVDFFCPAARLVIEVDGSQHEEAAQQMLDARRDRLLRLANVRTLRFSTKELADPAKAIAKTMSALREGFALRADAPLAALAPDGPAIRAIQAYELAMRLQVALIELLRCGALSPQKAIWRIQLAGEAPFETLRMAAEAAFQDVFALLSDLAILANVSFAPPEVVFVEAANESAHAADNPDAVLDVSAFRTWDGQDAERARTANSKAAPPRICIRSAHDPARDAYRLATARPIAYDMRPHRFRTVDDALRRLLKRLFGHDAFRPGQLGIIRRALSRKPTLGILPTGSGKSVCYQLACLLQPAVSFVVCPIVSLIQDQDRSLRAHGIAQVARLDSQMSTVARARVRKGIGEGRFQIIWVSPERFQDAAFRQELLSVGRTLAFGCAVIDEVHCLSEWGHDFRVSYLLLKRTFSRFCPEACLLGLTATASRDVLADLKAELGITSENVRTAAALDRPELHFHIRRTTSDARLHDLDAILEEEAARLSLGRPAREVFRPCGEATVCGIVFANTRTGHAASKAVGCEEIKDHLRARGIMAETYHSGRAEERAQIQKGFMDNEFPLMVATKSFGMGIDKPNVRITVHANLPWSIESFYQEAGRAGRARKDNEAHCYILYVPDPDEGRTRRLFAPATTIEEIHQLQPQLQGDLSTIFFLWNLGFADFADELTRMLTLLAKLEEARDAQDFAVISEDAVDDADVRADHAGMQTEKALYKLALCGVVLDWTHDWNRRALTVELSAADGGMLARAEAAVEGYIARHSPGFSLAHPHGQHVPYVRIARSVAEDADCLARLASLMGMLLRWTNDTIVYARRKAIGNMFALCQAGLADQQIGEYINGYFKLDTRLAARLERAAESPDDIAAWLDVFYESAQVDDLAYERRLRSTDELAHAVPLTDRFRESYPDSVSLEWVSLMAKLLANAFLQEDVNDQFAYVFNCAARDGQLDFDELLDETVKLVGLCAADAQAAYERAIVSWHPDFGM